MANFNTHATVAVSASAIGGITIFLSGIQIPIVLLLIAIGSIGGILPDIDSDNSTSKDIVYSILSLMISTTILFTSLNELGLILSLVIAVISFTFIKKVGHKLMSIISRHRGIIHSVPMAIILGISSFLIINLFINDMYMSWLFSSFLVFGFLIHLILDEVYAVDFSGRTLKKSFGTALTFISFRNNLIGYLIVYISIIFLGYFFYRDLQTFPIFLNELQKNMENNVLDKLLPVFIKI
jgi:hypothetical protein